MIDVPQKLIDTVCDYLIKNYLPTRYARGKTSRHFNNKDIEFFAESVALLSDSFTKGRRSLPKNYLNLKEFRAGYILYFLISNYLKASFTLSEASIPEKKSLKILDIGSGPGTALLAASSFFKDRSVSLTAVDQNRHILKDASSLISKYAGLPVKTIAEPISARNVGSVLHESAFDVIFLSNFVGEIRPFELRAALIQKLLGSFLSADGSLIIIEPALRETSRDLMTLRDDLLTENPNISVQSLCLHDLPCPMLRANNRDWCHVYLEWRRPELIEKIDRLIGNQKNYLKFSYLILKNKATVQPLPDDVSRVVSSPLISKGKKELLICNCKGLIRLCRQDKDRSSQNFIFDELKRGDLVSYSGDGKIIKDSIIKRG